MIKVIKDNTKETFYTKCGKCKSELTYEYKDVSIEEIPYVYFTSNTILCPICGHKTVAEMTSKKDYNENVFPLNPAYSLYNSCCSTDNENEEG